MTVETIVVGFIMAFAFALFGAAMYALHEANKASVIITKRKNEKGKIVEQYVDPQAKFLTDKEKDECIEAKANWILQCHPSLPETLSAISSLQAAIGVASGFVVKTFIHTDESVAQFLATRYMTSVKMKTSSAA